MALELSQPLNQAIDALTRESNDMDASFRSSFLHIKMAAKFLVQEDNKEAWERDPEFLKQQTEELVAACKKLVEEECRLKRWGTALAEMRTSDGKHGALVTVKLKNTVSRTFDLAHLQLYTDNYGRPLESMQSYLIWVRSCRRS